VDTVTIRPAEPRDVPQIAALCHALWPDGSIDEHARELAALLLSGNRGTLPATILIAQDSTGSVAGFIDCGLRSHADGCDSSHPVGYIEGWYVVPSQRRRGIAARLLAAAEQWAIAQGCHELASDTWIDNLDSQRVHEALGFEVVDRCVNYRKKL